MLALRRMTVEVEMMKWILLILAAMVIAMFLVSRVQGADATPGLLPEDMDRWARPMEPAEPPYFPEVGPRMATDDHNQVLWRIIELHRQGQVEAAIDAWQQASLPCATEGWKYLVMGAAQLQMGDAERAEQNLTAALEIDPNNAAAHYFVALLRLRQADHARSWPDAIGPRAIMLIALPAIVPNSRGMYELAAMQEFEKAIELAPGTDLMAPLTMEAWDRDNLLPVVTPMAADLMEALGADRYPARAHDVLGDLYLKQGNLTEAEVHIDAAAAEGMNGRLAYRTLGRAMEQEGRYDAAARIYLKAFRNGDPNLVPALKILENGWKAAAGIE